MARKNKSGEMPNGYLHGLFVDELKDILRAERQLLKELKKLSDEAHSATLKEAFKKHYQQTEGHIELLKMVFSNLDLTARGQKSKAVEGPLNEAE